MGALERLLSRSRRRTHWVGQPQNISGVAGQTGRKPREDPWRLYSNQKKRILSPWRAIRPPHPRPSGGGLPEHTWATRSAFLFFAFWGGGVGWAEGGGR